ncbi:hypothetical protein [Actinoallomurus bryophytorum]|nr:hypothetical protein [Actinoallomurus bryophytorum]
MFEAFDSQGITKRPTGPPGYGIDSGHHVAEEAPDALATSLGDFFAG